MTNKLIALVGIIGATALAGCVESSGSSGAATSTGANTASAADQRACLNNVAGQTNNSVRVLRSETSEANTVVTVGVGPDAAPWKCLVKDGVVAEAYFDGNEGTL